MQKIIDFLNKNDNFLITSHVAPDGDNIGSSIALTRFLQNMGKRAYHFLDDNTPESLDFIVSRVKIYKSGDFDSIFANRDYHVIVLDCANKGRVNVRAEILDKAKIIACIDHHESNENFSDISYVEKSASSTCEMVYNVLKKTDDGKIDEIVATALYTGLATDTGHFKFDCTKQSSFYMAADLMSKNALKQEVVRNIYQSENYDYKRMQSDLILNNMQKDGEICIMTMPKSKLEKYGIDIKDTEDLVNNTLNIRGVELGILIKEKHDGVIKGSLRSKKAVDCNEIAKHFGGGGHKRAAGFTINGRTLEDAKTILLDYVRQNAFRDN